MANVSVGDTDYFDVAAYGRPNSSIYQFIDHHRRHITNTLSDAAQTFFDTAQDVYRAVTESEALRRVKAVGRKVKSAWLQDGIYNYTTVEQMQQAVPQMQRWIMAEPTIRTLYHEQLCDGYHGTYYDSAPGKVGEDHYDYRRVMNGVVTVEDDGGWYANNYHEELLEGDSELDLLDQSDILETWRHVRQAVKDSDDDPTSPSNSPL